MNETGSDETRYLTLKVIKSAIDSVDSGVARIHTSHLGIFENNDIHLVEIKSEKKQKVVRLVSDRFAKKDHVVLREGDMEDLEVEEGDEVGIHPYKNLSEDVKENWRKLKDRFRSKKEEEEK